MEGTALALCILNSVLFCSVGNVFRDLRYFYRVFAHFLHAALWYVTRDDSYVEDEHDDERRPTVSCCCERGRVVCSGEDVRVLVDRLGIGEWREEGEWREAVEELLEAKEASEEEAREAFYVFDRNEDGFITPEELWSVMRRLGMREGVRMEDCVRMVRAVDEDGDGRVSFLEFKRLLENAL